MSNEEELEQEFIEALDNMPLERHRTAYQRACKSLNIETWYEGETLCVDDEHELDEDDILDAYMVELNKMVFEDTMFGLVEDGLVEATANEDGELMFRLTDEGQELGEKLIAED